MTELSIRLGNEYSDAANRLQTLIDRCTDGDDAAYLSIPSATTEVFHRDRAFHAAMPVTMPRQSRERSSYIS